MGRLFLVRHAQASFLSQNYDQLSTLGEKQANLLGEYWAQRNVVFDRVCTGPALRHQHTAQLVSNAYRKAGRHFPSPTVAAEFDEFQGEAVLSESLPQLLASNPKIRELHRVLQSAGDDVTKRANFQRLFEAVISMWVSGEITPPSAEPWRHFCARVNRGLSAFLVKSCKGQIAAIFTSGGPISLLCSALCIFPRKTRCGSPGCLETVRTANSSFPACGLCSVHLTRFPIWTTNR